MAYMDCWFPARTNARQPRGKCVLGQCWRGTL